MPLRLPDKLPAIELLKHENIFVMDIDRAARQDIRPLRILLLNLMPTKIATETQLARLLGNTLCRSSWSSWPCATSRKTPRRSTCSPFTSTFPRCGRTILTV